MQYNGGKNHKVAFQTIINQMPPHKIYIEPFLGSGAIIRNKLPAEVNIGIEIDQAVINNFHSGETSGYIVINSCSISCLKLICATAGADTLIYADPPYPKCSRRSQEDIYNYELTDDDHRQILSSFRSSKAKIIVSTLANEIYSSALANWRVVGFNNPTRVGIQKELLYCNFPEPTALHDYSFLGKDKTDKQRIRRKIDRWSDNLKGLPLYERQAIIQQIITEG